MRADGLARHWKGTAGTLCMKPLVDEEAILGQHNTVLANATTAMGTPTPAQNLSTPVTSLGTTVPGWDSLLLPAPQYAQGVLPDLYGYDDRYPLALYDQHPEISGINWDVVLPE